MHQNFTDNCCGSKIKFSISLAYLAMYLERDSKLYLVDIPLIVIYVYIHVTPSKVMWVFPNSFKIDFHERVFTNMQCVTCHCTLFH